MLASGLADGTVKLWEIKSGRSVAILRGHGGRVRSVAFSPDGTKLAVGSRDTDRSSHGMVKLWEVPSTAWDVLKGQSLEPLDGQPKVVFSVVFSPDSRTLASGASNGVKLWDASTGKHITTLDNGGVVAFLPDGQTLAVGVADRIKLWDIATGKKITTFSYKNYLSAVAFSPNGKTLAVGIDEKIELWDVETKRHIATRHAHGDAVTSLVFSPDGKMLASGAPDGTTLLWNVSELIDN